MEVTHNIMITASTDGNTRKLEYGNKHKEFHKIYSEVLSLGLIKMPKQAPSGLAKYSDGSYAIYLPYRPDNLGHIIPASAVVVAIRIEADKTIWYKWYERGNTSDISSDSNAVATGRFSNSNKITLYYTEEGSFESAIRVMNDYSAITYLNGAILHNTVYKIQEKQNKELK